MNSQILACPCAGSQKAQLSFQHYYGRISSTVVRLGVYLQYLVEPGRKDLSSSSGYPPKIYFITEIAWLMILHGISKIQHTLDINNCKLVNTCNCQRCHTRFIIMKYGLLIFVSEICKG